jgi:excisionase family DNA binding protein
MSATVTQIHGVERWLTKEELAEILAVSTSWIDKRMAKDGLPYRKRGRAVRFRLSEVDEWEAARQ